MLAKQIREKETQIAELDEKIQKYNIDTVLINKILLNDLGIKDKNIIDSNLCSVCNKDILYSYRAEGKASKRNVAIISL